MNFRIADTFTDSLARLTGEEQKAVKTTAFDLQLNPTSPGMQFHRLDRARDKNFWSVRVNQDVRLIVHRTQQNLLLAYVGHHDAAYQWAERRRLETHPKTGAAQWVEVRERIEQIVIPQYIDAQVTAPPKPPVFASVSPEDLLTCGVPLEWLGEVRKATEDSLLELAPRLPAEAAEALLDLATGVVPAKLRRVVDVEPMRADLHEALRATDVVFDEMAAAPLVSNVPDAEAFEHPDARRRFRTVANIEELARALEYPWEKWTVFLHPAQREAVEKDYGGPARVSGSAGTGKTIVALHRAVFLARANPDARVLLTTFSGTLANALRTKLRRLIGNEPRIAERLEVHATNAIARRLHDLNVGRSQIASRDTVRELLKEAAATGDAGKLSLPFLMSEWEQVVDAWQLETWEAYRDVPRLGRKTRLPEKQRLTLWGIFQRVRERLSERGLVTWSGLLTRVAGYLGRLERPPFEHVVVDEAQDVGVAQLRFLAALGAGRPNGLFFAGDLGQRIFQQPFSWKALGVEIRGRSRTLRINYRTSHQIRARADRLLAPEMADVDGNKEDRRGAMSVFNGPEPDIRTPGTPEAEIQAAGQWIADRIAEGVKPEEVGVFVRSSKESDRARAALEVARVAGKVLDEEVETITGKASISTMHLAKGLEFRAVAVMACDDDIIPSQERIASIGDDADLDEVYATERQLLYVACTRARDHLLVTGVAPASEFLDDLSG
ncbi:MAG TPA: UvrD-helicase domain-containing protein [Vicinamibacteria bacterium]|nr:UvrD-helicase domain-containing protein [Vicinamibacteria bacterium]